MIPNTFSYHRAESLDEALGWLRDNPDDTKVIAGGHSLLPLMKMRLADPRRILDISRIPELSGITIADGYVSIGAATVYRDIMTSADIKRLVPLLSQAAGYIGDMQVRNRGTIGGSISHADPSADLPAVLLALNAEVEVATSEETTVVPIVDFIVGPMMTVLTTTGIVTRVRIPLLPSDAHTIYLKYPHPASGYAVVGVAAVVVRRDGASLVDVRIGVTGVAAVAFRAQASEEILRGQQLSNETIAQAADAADSEALILEDVFMSEEYRRNLCKVYVKRALQQLL